MSKTVTPSYAFRCKGCGFTYDVRNPGADAYFCGKWCREQADDDRRMTELFRKARAEAKVVQVTSSDGHSIYEVRTYPDGHKSCTCRGFQIRRTCAAVLRDAKDGEAHTI